MVGETPKSHFPSAPLRGGQRRGFLYSLPLSGGDTEGVSTGGNLTQPSPERRGRNISSPIRGGLRRRFH